MSVPTGVRTLCAPKRIPAPSTQETPHSTRLTQKAACVTHAAATPAPVNPSSSWSAMTRGHCCTNVVATATTPPTNVTPQERTIAMGTGCAHHGSLSRTKTLNGRMTPGHAPSTETPNPWASTMPHRSVTPVAAEIATTPMV